MRTGTARQAPTNRPVPLLATGADAWDPDEYTHVAHVEAVDFSLSVGVDIKALCGAWTNADRDVTTVCPKCRRLWELLSSGGDQEAGR